MVLRTSKIRHLRLAAILIASLSAARADIVWRSWSPEVFAQARREHKYVLLDLEAVWCHWCHVMADVTYADPRVAAEIARDYIPVRVDEDSRPDLAARYEDYGWPATVIYAPDGTEIVKKQGYVPPGPMDRLLLAVVADPSPIDYGDALPDSTAGATGDFPAGLRAELERRWLSGYDEKEGGWGFSHKFLDCDSVELALREAGQGDAASAGRARRTLDQALRLIDPAWGGAYQYSVDGVWTEPHFEKIMPVQAGNLRIYALAYAQGKDPAFLAATRSIRRYLRSWMTSPAGAFHVSQDADLHDGEESDGYFALSDAGRRARGVPRVDRHLYARENGWAIAALAEDAAWTGDAGAGREAETAARWVVAHRAVHGGGFRHDEADADGRYLGDTLAMGRAFLALYQLTADRAWLDRAVQAADFMQARFSRGTAGGYAASAAGPGEVLAPRPQFDENVAVVRFAAALAAAAGRPADRAMGETALRWLLAPGVAKSQGVFVAGLLLAEPELRGAPLHIAVIGRKDDPVAAALYAVALRVPTADKLIEWWDRREGPAPRGEDIYPDLPTAAAFLCDRGACSSPLPTPAALEARLARNAAR